MCGKYTEAATEAELEAEYFRRVPDMNIALDDCGRRVHKERGLKSGSRWGGRYCGG
jgi:hypothetical protein